MLPLCPAKQQRPAATSGAAALAHRSRCTAGFFPSANTITTVPLRHIREQPLGMSMPDDQHPRPPDSFIHLNPGLTQPCDHVLEAGVLRSIDSSVRANTHRSAPTPR